MVLKKNIPNSKNSTNSIKEIHKNMKALKRREKEQTTGKKSYSMTPQNKALRDLGDKIIKGMSRNDRENLSCKSETLHFVRLLGLDSKRTTRTVYKNGERIYDSGINGSPVPIGITLRTDDDINVPVIDVTINKDTGIDIEKELSYDVVESGKEFQLTLYELMFLMLEDKYAGFFEVNGDPFGVKMELKTNQFIHVDEDGNIEIKVIEDEEGIKKLKLPTPTVKFVEGSIREGIVAIDEQGPDGLWRIKQGYEKFDKLIVNKKSVIKKAQRKANKSNTPRNSTVATKPASNNSVNSGFVKQVDTFNYSETTLLAVALQKAFFEDQNKRNSCKDEAALLDLGQSTVSSMDQGDRTLLGSKSGTLHLKKELNFIGHVKNRAVGVTLVSDEDIRIPIIPVTLDYFDENYVNSINPVKIDSKIVNAGEEFDITLYEFMFLIIQNQYAGHCEAFGDPKGICFVPNLKSYIKGKVKLPVPRIKGTQTLERVNISDIINGVTQIKPEYIEKFCKLLI
ncbi:hypothetical protein [uncultured Brevibacillus sp.]|uniref:hypothetical protein n=1 Tax=uncultured Brevibacillus sp. TaxID=169970 RepID=UPI002599A6CC|nr:hypothetical protein [uncultured Brevibacillus sp.]